MSQVVEVLVVETIAGARSVDVRDGTCFSLLQGQGRFEEMGDIVVIRSGSKHLGNPPQCYPM